MVVKINAATPHCSTSLQYNERKVAEGKASVVFSSNIADMKHPEKTFEKYEKGSIRCQKVSFHMSINPSVTDKINEQQVVAFAGELMEKLGYGDQPYIVYKHNDIKREHYHVVSVRVNQEGHKIPDSNERRRCQKIMKELAPKYGFTIGKGKEDKTVETQKGEITKSEPVRPEEVLQVLPAEENPADEKTEQPDDAIEMPEDVAKEYEEWLNSILEEEKEEAAELDPYKPFDPEAGDIMKQIETLTRHAMLYHFTVERQFDVIMKSFGVEVEHVKGKDGEVTTQFYGLDPKTHEHVTAPIPAKDLNVPTREEIIKRTDECKEEKRDREKLRAGNLCRYLLGHSKSQQHFDRMCAKKGLFVELSRTADKKIFGVTIVDHQTKCVFKASEIPKLSAAMFEKARIEQWHEKEEHAQSTAEKLADEALDTFLSALGGERSRRNEDEEIMRRGRKR